MKARKQTKAMEAPAKDAPAKDGPTFLAYVGGNKSAGVCGYTLPHGIAVEVSEAVAARFADHPDFEVSRGNVHAR